MFFLGEYIHVVVISAMAVTLVLRRMERAESSTSCRGSGRCSGSWSRRSAFVYLFVWLRATLPRLRYDRLMWLGWKRLIPAALAVDHGHRRVVNPEAPTSNCHGTSDWRVFGALFLLVLFIVAKGDPRLKEIVTPRAPTIAPDAEAEGAAVALPEILTGMKVVIRNVFKA